jgi:diguanylate cyclase (GGDEF)-like protein
LIAVDRNIGILSLQSLQQSRYDAHDLSVLATLAQQTVNAIESARHYERSILDELTGLYQKKYLFQRLQDELLRFERYGSTFALLMLDLDSFKPMNDQFGHLTGDRYLRALGEAIRQNLRAADIPCRYGGEEFAIILPETDLPGATVIAERIREAVEKLELREGARPVHTTVSIGIAVQEGQRTASAQHLVERADQALYAAKRAGKNRVVAAAA